MNHFFKVIDKQTGIEKKRISYHSDDYRNLAFRKRLQQDVNNGNILIQCGCYGKVEMKLSNTKKPYLYPASREQTHSVSCLRKPSTSPRGEYERAWRTDDATGELIVNLPNLRQEDESNDLLEERVSKFKEHDVVQIQTGTKKQEGKATMFALGARLNMMAWQYIVEVKEKLPEGTDELLRYVWMLSRQIRPSRSKTMLNEYFYESYLKKKPISNMEPKKDWAFVYMVYQPSYRQNLEQSQDKIGYKMHNVVYGRSAVYKKDIGFYVEDLEAFDYKLKKEPHSDSYLLVGFASRASKYHHKRLTLSNYALIPISNYGLFVESSHEKYIYDQHHKEDKRFYKPFTAIEGYGSYIPDYVLMEDNKLIIGEIFGINGNEEYEKRKNEKKQLSATKLFRELYEFRAHEF